MKYDLVGIDGNAFVIMGYVTGAMREQKFTKAEIDAYRANAMSSDYDHLLMVSVAKIEECNERAGE